MAFEWLNDFHRGMEKDTGYAERALAAYRLGMKAKGAIVGVAIQVGPECCEAARALDPDAVYHPADAPRLPLEGCPRDRRCTCAYRPVMAYQRAGRP